MAKKTKTLKTSKAKAPSEFAKFVIRYRNTNDMSQRDLAKLLNVSNSAVPFVEQDRFEMPIAFFAKLLPHLDEGDRAYVFSLFKDAVVTELKRGGS